MAPRPRSDMDLLAAGLREYRGLCSQQSTHSADLAPRGDCVSATLLPASLCILCFLLLNCSFTVCIGLAGSTSWCYLRAPSFRGFCSPICEPPTCGFSPPPRSPRRAGHHRPSPGAQEAQGAPRGRLVLGTSACPAARLWPIGRAGRPPPLPPPQVRALLRRQGEKVTIC